jgi:SAM-dependent methyltransferase
VSVAFVPAPRPRDLERHLGEIPPGLFDDRIFASCELADRYATDLCLDLVGRLDLGPALAGGGTVETLAAGRGFVDSFRPALGALLDRLAVAGEIERDEASGRYAATAALRAPELAELRRIGVEVDPAVAATLDLLDAAAAAYPAVAAGTTTGEQELFSAGRIGLWLTYFSNANPAYALSNLQAAVVAANRLPEGAGARVLEVGAGAGSATRTLLEELERRGRLADLARYDFTEPSPFFRRRGERELKARFPSLPLVSRALDLDRPLAGQETPPESVDLAFGVNVLHVAHDLGAALGEIRTALRPGGWLVAGECLRLFPGQPVPADLVFQIFDSFTQVATDPELRPHHGFLEPSTWRRALAAAGFEEVAVVPDLDRIRELYPRFFAGVVCGRRPPLP